jgi:uncharacterized protein (TIGR03437 family)
VIQMRISVGALLLFIFVTADVVAAAPNQFVARYVPIGTSGSSNLLAVDASGNFFVVATVEETSGFQQMRAIKTDPQGNILASFDFGSGSDIPAGAAVDAAGNLVLVGTTYAPSFPAVSPPVVAINYQAGFIVELDSQLTKILFSTLLGGGQASSGAAGSSANAVALDAAGNIYVTGSTGSSDFPVTPGAFQTTGPTPYFDMGFPVFAFVTEVSPDGSGILYSTLFGSNDAMCIGDSGCLGTVGVTSGSAIALDSTGAIVIAGGTTSTQLPATPGTLGQQCNCTSMPDQIYVQSGFLAKFAAGGKQLDWATYIPLAETGFESDYVISITAVAIDSQGNVVFGGSASPGLAVTKGALQASYPSANSSSDYGASFVSKVDAAASSYLFSTYVGEGIWESPAGALALDSQGDIWLTGGSGLSALPFPASIPLLGSTFVAELSADGSSVLGGVTAPAGAAGVAIVITPSGSPAALGSAGSLLLDLPGQPASLVGIQNSAGIQVSSNVAPYELVSLFGVGLGPATALGGQIVNGALTDSLGGVQVLFNNVAAPLLYVGPNQINAIVPSSVVEQDTTAVQIITPNGTLTGPTISVVPSEPEVFQNGPPMPPGGPAVALNQDGSLNSATNPAAGGSVVTVWATGGGLENSAHSEDGMIPPYLFGPLLPVSVLSPMYTITGGLDSLEVLYAGSGPGMVTGALQVNFRLPQSVGTYDGQIPCQLQIGAAASSRFSIYVQ